MAFATPHNEIEVYFNKALSPIRKEADPNIVAQFCQKLNNDLDGVHTAVRLITNKMQSEQEWESLIALYILEACVKNCGPRFHAEIGKFRFLNEMIKLVSPKYLASKTTDKVKRKVVELMYSWTQGLSNETKIVEAYQMLKRQGIVDQDPTYVDTNFMIYVTPRPKNRIFDDPEKSNKLSKLLQSKNPQDLEEANRLIKSMVQQEELKTEKISSRVYELEHLNDNVKLLTDMLFHYNKSTISQSEKETMKFIYEELEKKQPNLIKLASETDDNDDGIGEIIKTNEDVIRVLGQYKGIVHGENLLKVEGFNDDVLMINTTMSTNDIQINPTKKNDSSPKSNASVNSNSNYDPLKELEEIFSNTTLNTNEQTNKNLNINETIMSKFNNNEFGAFTDEDSNNSKFLLSTPTTNSNSLIKSNNNSDLFDNLFDVLNPNQFDMKQNSRLAQPLIATSSIDNSKPLPTTSQSTINQTKLPHIKAMDDLNAIGRTLLEQTLNTNDAKKSQPQVAPIQNLFINPTKKTLSLNEMQQKPQSPQSQQSTTDNTDYTELFNSLNSLFIPLETIKPGSQAPLTAYEHNNLKVVFHFGRDSPKIYIHVIVVSIMSTNPSAINKISFQAAVPKSMKVKLQPASGSDLPPYNPILPISAITQVMLIANPSQDKIRLKFKLNYSIDNKIFNESGDINDLPVIRELI